MPIVEERFTSELQINEKWEVLFNMKFTFDEVKKILEKCDEEILFPDETIL